MEKHADRHLLGEITYLCGSSLCTSLCMRLACVYRVPHEG